MCTGMEAAGVAAIIGAGGKAAADNISAIKQETPRQASNVPPLPDVSGLFDNDELMSMLMPKPQMGMGGF